MITLCRVVFFFCSLNHFNIGEGITQLKNVSRDVPVSTLPVPLQGGESVSGELSQYVIHMRLAMFQCYAKVLSHEQAP